MSTVPRQAPLVAIAHGSRDPRSAATVREITALAADLSGGVVVRESFLDLSEPSVGEVLAELYSRGHRDVVATPLLLGSAYHARTDLPALVQAITSQRPTFEVATADVLGIDPLLEEVALDRLRDAGADPGDDELGIVLAAVGSSHPPANDAVARLAERWQRDIGGARVCTAFAAATNPDVPAAIAGLRARGARRIAVASWFLAPGLLPDRVARLARETEPDVRIAHPLGADPRVARVLLDRYAAAAEPGSRYERRSDKVSA